MMRYRLRTLLIMLLSLCPMRLAADEVDQLVEAVQAAKQPQELQVAFDTIARHWTEPKIATLTSHPNSTIAIRAKWTEVVAGQSEIDRLGDLPRAHRFLGFIEGRERVRIPQWWFKAFVEGERASNGVYIFGNLGYRDYYQRTDSGYFVERGTKLELLPEGAKVTIDSRSVLIPRAEFKEATEDGSFKYVDACWQDQRCFVAVHSDIGSQFPLLCIDTMKSSVEWSTTIWAADIALVFGPSFHRVGIFAADKRVFVFGVTPRAVYCEAIAQDSAKHHFRFCTQYMRP